MFSLSVSTYCKYVDRLLALLLGLTHRQVVTLKQTYVIVVTIWVVSTAFSGIRLSNSLISLRYWIIITGADLDLDDLLLSNTTGILQN